MPRCGMRRGPGPRPHLSHHRVRPRDGDSDWGTPLHVAVWCNNLEPARLLVDAGADPLLEKYEPTLPYSFSRSLQS